jgi:hypothetical protein
MQEPTFRSFFEWKNPSVLRRTAMKRLQKALGGLSLGLLAASFFWLPAPDTSAASPQEFEYSSPYPQDRPEVYQRKFEVQVLVNGQPLEEYYGRNRTYIEAQRGAEYELRIHNPLPFRVAVALSVDGLNSIDARRTTAWNASKWVIRPYETIVVSGWQMSSERARRFYFTSEQDSYAAKLGQASNLGLISAVFFRERAPRPITILPPIVPKSEDRRKEREAQPAPEERSMRDESSKHSQQGEAASRLPNDDYAATGIGRSVENDVRWIQMELDSKAVGEVAIRYEYYSALVRLGIRPRGPRYQEVLPRRERATGFEDRRFSPEPPR